jgi:hypothetical protein
MFARRLVTDQTGTLYDWAVGAPSGERSTPDSTALLSVSDTTVRELAHLGDCVWYQLQLSDAPVPVHPAQVCALAGDTTTVPLASGVRYRVEYLYIPPLKANGRGDFGLSARPAPYGREETRSFLIRDRGREIFVTTEDRAARPTDFPVHKVDFGAGTLRIETQ